MTTSALLTRRNFSLSPSTQHIALLGATGGTGLALIKEHLTMPESPQKPYLTLYTRPSGRSKLASILPKASTSLTPASKIRIIQGELNDASTIRIALSASASTASDSLGFPQVTTVLTLLGSYVSLNYFLTRRTPTPIADAISQTVIPTMRDLKIRRILAFSTATAYRIGDESRRMSWSWYFFNMIPRFIVPQGNAEMGGMGKAVLNNDGGVLRQRDGLDATVIRLPPIMDAKGPELEVLAYEALGEKGASESKAISKASLARWLLKEVNSGEWNGRAPIVVNPSTK